ncbi:hypothetical protein [Bacillus sp. FJAT-47783]|uniref:hypothetical protein n=1 Tax=Bacillus sp. FJAT-47783 TaxID=2922712 RepID=UPI001FABB510|nr:hypothetical protein [Bacillus sp. FJAT-47783]
MNNQDQKTIQRLKGRIAYLQEELANARAELLDYKENHHNQKEISRLESENMVLKELLAKYEQIDLDQYEAFQKETKQLKGESEKSIVQASEPVSNREDSWFINNLKNQSSSQLNTKSRKD